MNFEVYSYWTTTELVALFNAVAALTNSDDFFGLMKLLAMIALFSVTLVVLGGRGRMDDMWRWIIMFAILHGMLIVPKASVVIIDRTTANPNPQIVSNVPLGIASLAGAVSKIGDWMTTSFETVFALPGDVQFRKSGTLFGARVLQEIMAARSGSPVLSANMTDFFRECVWPEFATGYVPPHEVIRQPDIWGYLSGRTNIARFVEIRELPTGIMMLPMTCPDAYNQLTTQISTVTDTVIGGLSNVINPGVPLAMRQAMAQSQIVTSAGLYTNISASAPNIMRQGLVMNMFLDAQYKIPAQVGDAASATTALAQVQALRSTSESYKVMAAVGQSVMPKMRNIIEMIQYALAPLALLIIVILGHYGLRALAMYAKSLVWIQLWPPLYAVMNYIMTMYGVRQADAVANGGMSLNTYAFLNNLMISDQAIAGMIAAVGIPVIAWMMVEGLSLGASAFGNILRSPTGAEAARYAASASQGNISMGQLSVDNQTMGQHNTAPNIHQGAPVLNETYADGLKMTRYPDGTVSYDASGLQHRMNMSMDFSSRGSASLSKQSELAQSSAVGNMVSGASTTAAALQKSSDFVRMRASSESAGTSYGAGDQTAFTQAVNQAQNITDSFAKRHGLNQSQAAQLMGIADAAMQNPKVTEWISPLSVAATARLSGKSEAVASQLLQQAIDYSQETGFSENLNTIRRASMDANFASSDESSRRAMEGIRASLDESMQHQQQASVNYQQSISFREAATHMEQSTGTWEASYMRPFIDWMGTQYNAFMGKNFDPPTVAQMAAKNPENLAPYMDQFYREYIEPQVMSRVGDMHSPEDVKTYFEHGKVSVPGVGAIQSQGSRWHGSAGASAATAGISAGSTVSSDLPQQWVTTQTETGQAIDTGRSTVTTQGSPLEQDVTHRTDPGSQSLSGLAVTNAAGQVLPDSVSRVLVNKIPGYNAQVPGVDMNLGTPGASVTEAGADRQNQGEPRNPMLDSYRKLILVPKGKSSSKQNEQE